MFLKNFYQATLAYVTNTAVNLTVCNGDIGKIQPSAGSKAMSVNTTGGSESPALNHLLNNYSGTSGGVLYGTGDAEVSYDDYKLSGDIITGLSATYKSTVTIEGNTAVISSVGTLTNNNSEAVTISEVGLMGKTQSSASIAYSYLADRTLLEKPITIEPGGVGQVTYSVRYTIPAE